MIQHALSPVGANNAIITFSPILVWCEPKISISAHCPAFTFAEFGEEAIGIECSHLVLSISTRSISLKKPAYHKKSLVKKLILFGRSGNGKLLSASYNTLQQRGEKKEKFRWAQSPDQEIRRLCIFRFQKPVHRVQRGKCVDHVDIGANGPRATCWTLKFLKHHWITHSHMWVYKSSEPLPRYTANSHCFAFQRGNKGKLHKVGNLYTD